MKNTRKLQSPPEQSFKNWHFMIAPVSETTKDKSMKYQILSLFKDFLISTLKSKLC